LALEYFRRLSITESTNQLQAMTTVTPELLHRRLLAGQLEGIPSPDEIAGHYLQGLPQYRVPTGHAKLLLQSFARHIALIHASARPGVDIQSVKIYRVVHGIVPPAEFAAGREPRDPTLYLPYFQGEFDSTGNLKEDSDPFLYWLIPILKVEKRASDGQARTVEILDFLELHANRQPQRQAQ
jgi:hypothetical protein